MITYNVLITKNADKDERRIYTYILQKLVKLMQAVSAQT